MLYLIYFVFLLLSSCYSLKLRCRKIKELVTIHVARKRWSQNSNLVFIWKIQRPVAL